MGLFSQTEAISDVLEPTSRIKQHVNFDRHFFHLFNEKESKKSRRQLTSRLGETKMRNNKVVFFGSTKWESAIAINRGASLKMSVSIMMTSLRCDDIAFDVRMG